MTFNTETLARVVETAKAKAAGNARWINAIQKAYEGLTGDVWIVTELRDSLLITTESGETYNANGVCQCEAYRRDTPCKHRAAARLVALYNEETAPGAVPAPVDYLDDEPIPLTEAEAEYFDRELAPMVRPEPAKVYAEGWSI